MYKFTGDIAESNMNAKNSKSSSKARRSSAKRSSDGDRGYSKNKSKLSKDSCEGENDEVLDKNNSHFIKYDKHHNPN